MKYTARLVFNVRDYYDVDGDVSIRKQIKRTGGIPEFETVVKTSIQRAQDLRTKNENDMRAVYMNNELNLNQKNESLAPLYARHQHLVNLGYPTFFIVYGDDIVDEFVDRCNDTSPLTTRQFLSEVSNDFGVQVIEMRYDSTRTHYYSV